MSKHLISFFLAELTTIRVHCASSVCGGVIEFPTSQLASLKAGHANCPVCGAPLRLNYSVLISLGQNIALLKDAGFEIEFVLPEKPDGSSVRPAPHSTDTP